MDQRTMMAVGPTPGTVIVRMSPEIIAKTEIRSHDGRRLTLKAMPIKAGLGGVHDLVITRDDKDRLEDALLDVLVDVTNQACLMDDGTLDSGCLSANAYALRALATHGLVVIEKEYGRQVSGRWNQDALAALADRLAHVEASAVLDAVKESMKP